MRNPPAYRRYRSYSTSTGGSGNLSKWMSSSDREALSQAELIAVGFFYADPQLANIPVVWKLPNPEARAEAVLIGFEQLEHWFTARENNQLQQSLFWVLWNGQSFALWRAEEEKIAEGWVAVTSTPLPYGTARTVLRAMYLDPDIEPVLFS